MDGLLYGSLTGDPPGKSCDGQKRLLLQPVKRLPFIMLNTTGLSSKGSKGSESEKPIRQNLRVRRATLSKGHPQGSEH